VGVDVPHVVDALLGLVEAEDAVASSLRDVDDAFVLAEGEAGGCAEAAEGDGADALLLHIDDEETAAGARGQVLPECAAVGEEDVARVVGEDEGVRAEQRCALVLVDEFGLLGVGGEGDDGLAEEVGEVVAALGGVEHHRPHLTVDLSEQLELSLQVLDDLAVEGAEHQRLLSLEGREQRRVHLQDLLGVRQREEHLVSYNYIREGSWVRGGKVDRVGMCG
jgi:hypothetical protein